MSRILNYLPQGWNQQLLMSRIREQPMFSDVQQVPDNYLLHFLASSKALTFMPGEVALHENEYGRNICFILEGRFTVSSTGPEDVSCCNGACSQCLASG